MKVLTSAPLEKFEHEPFTPADTTRLNALLTTAPEYEGNRWPPAPPARWGGSYPDAAVYPGSAFVLLVGVVVALALVDGVKARREGRGSTGGARTFTVTRGALALLLAALLGTLLLAARAGPSTATRIGAGVLLWAIYGFLLGSWPVVAANVVTLALSLTVLILKIRHG